MIILQFFARKIRSVFLMLTYVCKSGRYAQNNVS